MIDGTQADATFSTLELGKPDREAPLDARRRMSDHIAFALPVFITLQIFATVSELQDMGFSLLPFLALIALVGAIVLACRLFERRWEHMSDEEALSEAAARRFRRDRVVLWALALGLPLLLTSLFKGMAVLLA